MSVETEIKLIDNASKSIVGIDNGVKNLGEDIADVNNGLKNLGERINAINLTKLSSINEKVPSNLYMKINTTLGYASRESLNVGANFKSGFEGSFGMLAKLGASIYAINSVVSGVTQALSFATNYSDDMATTTARLNLMNNGLMTTDELWQEIFDSSKRTRGNILDTANSVAKIGLLTDDLFGGNNKELIQFTENLTKSFKIAGTDVAGINSVMLQLTQALGSGVLRGEEFNAVFENAPLLIQNIADYMGVPRGQIKKMAEDGKITADIVKNAILGATDEINTQFEELPITWEEVNTQFGNIAVEAFQPFLEELG